MSALLSSSLRAFQHRNYRLYFIAQFLSLIGVWMTSVASGWLVYRLTNSEFMLGMSYFCAHIPVLFLGPVAGVYVDRWNRRIAFLVTQVLALLQSVGLAAFALLGGTSIEVVLALQLFQGVVDALSVPARTALVSELVPEPRDLPNAIALNSMGFNLARLIGPAFAGLVIAAAGEGWCFVIDSLSFLPIILVLMGMQVGLTGLRSERRPVWQELVVGFRYASQHPVIKPLLIFVAMVSFFGVQYATLMPAVVQEGFAGGPALLGTMTSAVGAGALVGSLLLATRVSILELPRLIVWSSAVHAVSLILLSVAPSALIATICAFFVGAGLIFTLASCHTLVQASVEDDKRGRVMSLYGVAFLGIVPLGSLAIGLLAQMIGALHSLVVAAAGCVLAIWFFIHHRTRIQEQVRSGRK